MKNDQLRRNSEQYMYDCLHYYVKDNLNNEKEDSILIHQIILYCFRPLEEEFSYLKNTYHPNFTFDELRMMNVTSDQLYSWSAPIDIIEEYQIYLISNNTVLSTTIFYNCTKHWFGPFCQYSSEIFSDYYYSPSSFADFVEHTLDWKTYGYSNSGDSEVVSNLSCYIHLQCDRGGLFPSCLNWREICNGRIDCIDGGFDEEHCDQLEINECNENEYRCHNGQCIPEEFLHDGDYDYDCLDRSDESYLSRTMLAYCFRDLSFRCEESTCYPWLDYFYLECGDGACTTSVCSNKRHIILRKAMSETSNVSDECRNAMLCYTSSENYCETNINITENCPKLFQFPGVPVLFGHVKLLYNNSRSSYNFGERIIPNYVCYDARLCSLVSTVVISNYSACRHVDHLQHGYSNINKISWDRLIYLLYGIFRRCSIVDGGYCHHHTLYSCNSTIRKCISKHRLLDGSSDCYHNDDEEFPDSCSLNNSKHRLQCDNKCISPILASIKYEDCEIKKNIIQVKPIDTNKQIYFQTICDGFVEISPPFLINGQNYTDETECDFWQCNNSYTRCDGYWNCLNGIDEVNCPPSTCPSLQHDCISPVNNTFICLPIEKAGDGIVDCLGASDERQLCRKSHSRSLNSRFYCKNDSWCTNPNELCNEKSICIHNDDEQFCTDDFSCFYLDSYSQLERFLCKLTDVGKWEYIPLILDNLRIYPEESQSSNITLSPISIEQNFVVREKIRVKRQTNKFVSIWRCNRGFRINVLSGENNTEERCLCPPSYYGDQCQYENQRVSLTLKIVASSEWRSLFSFLITLIDDDEFNIRNSIFIFFIQMDQKIFRRILVFELMFLMDIL